MCKTSELKWRNSTPKKRKVLAHLPTSSGDGQQKYVTDSLTEITSIISKNILSCCVVAIFFLLTFPNELITFPSPQSPLCDWFINFNSFLSVYVIHSLRTAAGLRSPPGYNPWQTSKSSMQIKSGEEIWSNSYFSFFAHIIYRSLSLHTGNQQGTSITVSRAQLKELAKNKVSFTPLQMFLTFHTTVPVLRTSTKRPRIRSWKRRSTWSWVSWTRRFSC